MRRTLNPVYDEDFTFYGIHFNQLEVSNITQGDKEGILGVIYNCWGSRLRNPITHLKIIYCLFFQGLTLHFVVLSFDRYSRDDVIGEVMLELDSIDLSNSDNTPVPIYKEITPRSYKVKTTHDFCNKYTIVLTYFQLN